MSQQEPFLKEWTGFIGVKIFAHASTNKHMLSQGSYTFSLSMGKPVNSLWQLFPHHRIFWGWERVRTILKYNLFISFLLSFASSLKINILTVLLIKLCTLRQMYIFCLEKLPPPFQGLAEISCHNPSSSTAILAAPPILKCFQMIHFLSLNISTFFKLLVVLSRAIPEDQKKISHISYIIFGL